MGEALEPISPKAVPTAGTHLVIWSEGSHTQEIIPASVGHGQSPECCSPAAHPVGTAAPGPWAPLLADMEPISGSLAVSSSQSRDRAAEGRARSDCREAAQTNLSHPKARPQQQLRGHRSSSGATAAAQGPAGGQPGPGGKERPGKHRDACPCTALTALTVALLVIPHSFRRSITKNGA